MRRDKTIATRGPIGKGRAPSQMRCVPRVATAVMALAATQACASLQQLGRLIMTLFSGELRAPAFE